MFAFGLWGGIPSREGSKRRKDEDEEGTGEQRWLFLIDRWMDGVASCDVLQFGSGGRRRKSGSCFHFGGGLTSTVHCALY